MVVLIFLNIILIIALIFLLIYFFCNKKNDVKNDCVIDNGCGKIEIDNYKQNKKINSGRVFEGRFVTDEECQQMMKNKRSDISILLEEVEREYEHLKELNK
jgi:hypothetical protein